MQSPMIRGVHRQFRTAAIASAFAAWLLVLSLWVASYFIGVHIYYEYGWDSAGALELRAWGVTSGRGGMKFGFDGQAFRGLVRSPIDNQFVIQHSNRPGYAEWVTSPEFGPPSGADHNAFGFHWDHDAVAGETGIHHEWRFVFPYWVISAIFALPSLGWLYFAIRRRHRLRAGRCPACGYDLRESAGLCPECGTAFIRAGKVRARKRDGHVCCI